MRLITILILIFVTQLYATQQKDICYNIQIGSFANSSLKDIQKLSFPQACKIIENNGAYAIKCECDTEVNIRKKLPYYQKNVPGAFLTKTDKKLFNQTTHNKRESTPQEIIQRIKEDKLKKQKPTKPDQKRSETLIELMYKVFIYNNDLKNAQKVALAALKRDPSNLMWRKYLADALSWSGKTKEAFKHYTYIYKKNRKKYNIKPKIEGYGSYDRYFMLLGKIYSNPKNQNSIDEFIKEAEKLGNSEEAVEALDKLYNKTKSVPALKTSANLYLKLGLKQEAMRRFKILEKAKLLDIKTAMTLSRVFFEEKKFTNSLNVLLSVKHKATIKDREYWLLLVNIYSYLKEDEKAAKLLRVLCNNHECKKGEYDKLISFYSKKDKEFTLKTSLKAFRQLKESSYFFSFTKMSLEKKDTSAVIQAISLLTPKEKREYKKLPLFWLTIASLDDQLGETKKAILAYKQALNLDPESIEILTQYSWYIMDKNSVPNLQNIVHKVEQRSTEDKKLYILAAAINYKLNHIQKAYKYYTKAVQSDPDNVSLKLDYANLLRVMGQKEYADKITYNVYKSLQNKMVNRPNLLKEKEFLKNYLRASISFIPAQNYREVMNYAKTILDRETYINMDISWKLYTKDGDTVQYLSKQLKKTEVWLESYLTIRSNNIYAMRELLYKYGAILPLVDKISMELKTKQIALARIETFEALEKIPNNQSLYRTKYDIDTQYGNKFNSEIGYESQGDLERSYIKIENIHHLANRYYLGASFNYGKNNSNNIDLSEDSTAKLWLKMLMNNGYIEAGGGYSDKYTQYPQYFFNLYNKLTNKLSIKLEFEKNKSANETLDLRLKGKKDYSAMGIRYQFNQRVSFEAEASNSNYKWQKGGTLGNAQRYNLQMQQKIKFSYPDILFREYLSIANFHDKGLKDLPDDYIEGGLGVQIGMGSLNRYSSSWKPYADLSTTYHDSFGLSFAGQIGVSGKFVGDDYLNLSLNYNRSAVNESEELWLLKLTHSYLY